MDHLFITGHLYTSNSQNVVASLLSQRDYHQTSRPVRQLSFSVYSSNQTGSRYNFSEYWVLGRKHL